MIENPNAMSAIFHITGCRNQNTHGLQIAGGMPVGRSFLPSWPLVPGGDFAVGTDELEIPLVQKCFLNHDKQVAHEQFLFHENETGIHTN